MFIIILLALVAVYLWVWLSRFVLPGAELPESRDPSTFTVRTDFRVHPRP